MQKVSGPDPGCQLRKSVWCALRDCLATDGSRISSSSYRWKWWNVKTDRHAVNVDISGDSAHGGHFIPTPQLRAAADGTICTGARSYNNIFIRHRDGVDDIRSALNRTPAIPPDKWQSESRYLWNCYGLLHHRISEKCSITTFHHLRILFWLWM